MRNRRSCFITLSVLLVGGLMLAACALVMLIDVRGNLNVAETLYLNVWLSSRDADLNQPAGFDDTPVTFRVDTGDTAAIIGQNLASQGLIVDADLFRNWVRYEGLDSALEAGTYFLNPTMTTPEIARTLTDSSRASITVRILEGWRREEIAAALDANPLLSFTGQDFLAATAPGAPTPGDFAAYVGLPADASLEGFLYPETYFLPPDVTAAELRDTLLATFRERVDPSLQIAAQQAGLTLYQAVTLASIVEREAVHSDEEALIASVYLNRLNAGMKLDADPTVQYGIGYRGDSWWPSITIADYTATQSIYNTYLYAGLPPGPIANPAVGAIQAVIYPEESGYIYFRAACSGSGYHVFAYTFEEHVANGNCP